MILALVFAVLLPITDGTELELAGRAATAFQDGVKLRAQGEHGLDQFRTAAACYEELRRRGVENAELEQNLGNAYFLADDLPHAILAYRRGLRRAPFDRTLRQCLAEARDQVIYPDNTVFGRPPLLAARPFLPAWLNNSLLAAAALLYATGCVLLTRMVMVRRWRYLLGGTGALLVAGLLTFFLGQYARDLAAEDAHPLVVIAEDGVLLRKGDALAFPTLYDTPVNRGVEARLLFERNGWAQLELSGGEVGWVSGEYVLIDR